MVGVTATVPGPVDADQVDSPDLRDVALALRSAGIAEVDASTRRRAEYSSDASNYRIVPAAVVYPHDAAEVAATLSVCRELGVALTARGGGTSIAGNSIGPGIVLDFSRHMDAIIDIDPEQRRAVVQPGVVLDAITAAAAPAGLRFGPDPSTHSRATIGGTIGNNACGSRALGYGRTSNNVLDLELLTADGTAFTARRYGREGLASVVGPELALLTRLNEIVNARLGLIRTEFGRFPRQVSGYSLEQLLPENGADLAKFLVGTEGTLAVLTQASVRLVPTPRAVALVVLGYPDMAAAADAAPGLLAHQPVALEGMNARLVDVLRRRRGSAAVPDLPRGGGWLFAETVGESLDEAVAAGHRLAADAGALESAVVTGSAAAQLWRIREDGAGLGGRTPAGEPAWPGFEDAAVPPAQLGAYLREFEGLMKTYELDALLYGHFGDGCVHGRIDFPFRSRPDVFRAFMLEAAAMVGRYGGSISGEHGDGRARSELLPFMYSAEAIATFAAVKDVFDPDDVLNPGVIVAPSAIDSDLRVPAARPLRRNLAFAYPHDHGDLSTAVHRCVGVGRCRSDNTSVGGVMCPSFLATRDEKDSTRGRARVLQEMMNGELVERSWGAPELVEALDLCLSCKGCSVDCPAGVDMATYKAEVLHQRYRRRLRPASHYALGWLPRAARFAARSPRLVNAVLSRPVIARAIKAAGGIDARRELPQFAPMTFRRWFAERKRPHDHAHAHDHDHDHSAGRPVMLWVDTFTDNFSPEVGQAAVRVLEAAGYSVLIPDGPVCCGLTWISTGQLDGARRQLRRTFAALQPALSAGLPIVGIEPSCTAVLRRDGAELLADDPRSAAIAASTTTLAELLAATEGFAVPRLDGVRAVAQPHCHHHAVMGWGPDQALLAAAGADVQAVGGCCGLAGNFGVERGHYEVSVAVAETALLPAVRAADADTVLLADGFSCRTQLQQLAGRDSVHLAQLLADALDAQARADTSDPEAT
jgi:FAD/FMN-containing dehydrogenase/Fe-S oxidoreductase